MSSYFHNFLLRKPMRAGVVTFAALNFRITGKINLRLYIALHRIRPTTIVNSYPRACDLVLPLEYGIDDFLIDEIEENIFLDRKMKTIFRQTDQ